MAICVRGIYDVVSGHEWRRNGDEFAEFARFGAQLCVHVVWHHKHGWHDGWFYHAVGGGAFHTRICEFYHTKYMNIVFLIITILQLFRIRLTNGTAYL